MQVYTLDSHRCVLSQPSPRRERGPQNVGTRALQPNEEEMTHHRLRQQPCLATDGPEVPPAW